MQREMRRKDRLVTDKRWMEDVLRRGKVLHLGLNGLDGWPYVVALCYGYRNDALYLHGAPVGLKTDLLAVNPKACFQVTEDAEVVTAEKPEAFTMKYRSVTGFGVIRTLTGTDEKSAGLNILMDQYKGPPVHLRENPRMEAAVWVARLDIEYMTGKNNGYPLNL
ncbi:MAG: pyridoxamine 5'-phosphate oxidase family protein [Synergistaceae bacterium]|nr:pyridoxamine 5'-phosphate oxidase family protein [Synergistaceae bacterium]